MRFSIPCGMLLLCLLFASRALGEDWELRLDDHIKERPKVEAGVVDFTVGETIQPFPRYFNELDIRTIRIRFSGKGGLGRKLSIVWSGGSQGPDRFAVEVDGLPAGLSRIVDSERRPYAWYRDDFRVRLGAGEEHFLEIVSIPEFYSAINFAGIRMADPMADEYQPLCPGSIGSLERYEKSLGDRGTLVKSAHLWIFAPYKYAAKAKALAPVLEEAYAEMVKIYGMHPLFKFSIEHFPEGHEGGWGGISGEGTIGYPLSALQKFAELKKRDVRGFAGYTEEMSHGFKDYFKCGGTYEALGVAVQEVFVRRMVPKRVADAFWNWRHEEWEETTRAYLDAGFKNPDPKKYPWNVLYTRILNHLFLSFQEEYGPEMWTDFFQIIRQMDYPLHRAEKRLRMKVYAEIFSALFGRDMREEFEKYGIDLDADPPWGWETYEK